MRFSATQNLNRPGLGSMAAEGSAFQDSSGKITASRGNPNLEPYKDNTLDFAVEYYFGDVGLMSASLFHKDIKNFIETVRFTDVPFSETGVPYSTIPGATASTIVNEFSMPVNKEGRVELTGLELAAQSHLSFLPAPFDNLGVVANYTYIDMPDDLTGISKTSYNATVYYETDRWGARASLNYRDKWYTGYNTAVMSASTRGFEGGTYVDATINGGGHSDAVLAASAPDGRVVGLDRRRQVDLPLPHDRRAAPLAGQRDFPLHVGLFIPAGRRIALDRDAVRAWPAPGRPVLVPQRAEVVFGERRRRGEHGHQYDCGGESGWLHDGRTSATRR